MVEHYPWRFRPRWVIRIEVRLAMPMRLEELPRRRPKGRFIAALLLPEHPARQSGQALRRAVTMRQRRETSQLGVDARRHRFAGHERGRQRFCVLLRTGHLDESADRT